MSVIVVKREAFGNIWYVNGNIVRDDTMMEFLHKLQAYAQAFMSTSPHTHIFIERGLGIEHEHIAQYLGQHLMGSFTVIPFYSRPTPGTRSNVYTGKPEPPYMKNKEPLIKL
jgi:hypothetical protein